MEGAARYNAARPHSSWPITRVKLFHRGGQAACATLPYQSLVGLMASLLSKDHVIIFFYVAWWVERRRPASCGAGQAAHEPPGMIMP